MDDSDEEATFINPEDIVTVVEDDDDSFAARLGGGNDNEEEEEEDDDDDDATRAEQYGEVDDAESTGTGDAGESGDAPQVEFESDSAVTFSGHTDSVFCVTCLSTRPNIVASGGGDDRAFVWDMETGETIACIAPPAHTDSVVTVDFSNDGKYLATGGMDGLVRVWDMSAILSGASTLVDGSDGSALASTCEGADEIQWCTWHPRGHVLLAGGADGVAWMWLAPSATVMRVFAGHSARLSAGGFLSGGKSVFTVGEDAMITVWDPKSGEPIAKMSQSADGRFHERAIVRATANPDGSIIVSGGDEGSVRGMHGTTGKLLPFRVEDHVLSVEAIAFSPAFPYMATSSLDGTARIYDTANMRVRHECDHKSVGVAHAHWHPSEPRLITATLGGTVHVWDGRTGVEEQQLHGHSDAVNAFVITPDGQAIVTAGEDHVCLVFRL